MRNIGTIRSVNCTLMRVGLVAGPNGGSMSKTLLLADDSVVIQKLVGLSFANEDIEIVTTDNGDDAVARAREIRPDVVLADVVMPGLSGYEVCEAIKQDPSLAHVPVLLLTGTFEAFDDARAAAAGADGQITKPFEAQSLVERVNEMMSRQPAEPTPAAAAGTESSSNDFDFFDSSVSNLSPAATIPPTGSDTASTDQTPAIDITDASLFGAPGDGATDELDTRGGAMALGESMAPEDGEPAAEQASPIANIEDGEATLIALPEPVSALPPSRGDRLDEFGDDLDLTEEMTALPPATVDLGSALDAVPADPGATIVAGIDDITANAATSPIDSFDTDASSASPGNDDLLESISEEEPPHVNAGDEEFEDLTIHAPSAAIDQTVVTASSPTESSSPPFSGLGSADPSATEVANLDVSLAEADPIATPTPANTLDFGPSNIAADELDFAFDVSEQAPVDPTSDRNAESFSSLMDISESQILVGPATDDSDSHQPLVGPSSETETVGSQQPAAPVPVVDDSFAAGFDVSASDLATASAPSLPDAAEPTASPPSSEGIAIGSRHDELEIGDPSATSNHDLRVPDLSPLVEQRIQETLEKVAWEAFSDLSESIVKQVIDRVEKIAWEVIPQMAETLVREEIRKMKGESD